MEKIRAIIFDAGGVLLNGHARWFIERCERKLGLKPVKDLFSEGKAVWGKMQLGLKEPRDEINDMFGGVDKEKLGKAMHFFEEEWPEDKEMVGLAKRLGSQYKVGLLSNTEKVHEKQWKRGGFLNLFDAVAMSHREHMAKPDERIFRIMLERLGLKAGECVFVDDASINVEAAKKLGFKAICFKNRQQLEKELKKRGIEL